MKILYILKQAPDETLKRIIKEQEKSHEVTVITLSEESDYRAIVTAIEECDKVICW